MASSGDLPIDLPEDQLDVVVELILRAGNIAQRAYSEEDKWDSTAFGTVLYRLTWNHLEEGLRATGVSVWFDEGSLRFEIGRYTCSVYSGGHRVGWDVHQYDFTRTPKRREAANPDQGQLFDVRSFDPPPVPNPEALRSLTFVYCGDPLFGTVALYLGAPLNESGHYRWGWVSCLYQRGGAEPGECVGAPSFPPFTDQPEGDLAVIARRDQGDENTAAAAE